MYKYYISKEWIISERAKQVYKHAAIWSLVLCGLIVWSAMGGVVPHLVASIYQPLLFLGVLGTAITFVAMEYFLFGFDRNPALKKTFWFVVLCFPPIGPAIYCLTVYMKADPSACGEPQRLEDIIH